MQAELTKKADRYKKIATICQYLPQRAVKAIPGY